MFFSTIGFPNSPNLFRNIDSHRAPRDAAAATYTARRLKLIDPRSQLVRHPLPVARVCRRPHDTSVNGGMIGRETRVPSPPSFSVIARDVRYVLNGAAEA